MAYLYDAWEEKRELRRMLQKQTGTRSSTTNRRMTNKIPIGEGEWIGREFLIECLIHGKEGGWMIASVATPL